MSWDRYWELGEAAHGEYYDGALVTSPGPDQQHQLACRRLANLLDSAVPPGYTVNEGWNWSPADGQNFIPDVMVYAATDERVRLTATPVLVVEVLSSNRSGDLVVKTTRYAAAGLKHFWVLDRAEGKLHAFELSDGVYVKAQVVSDSPAEVSFGVASVLIDVPALLS
jgi:Uma2 family endonuclease